jgi:hypothetical protein
MGAHNIKAKMEAKAHPEDHIADVTITTDLTGVATGTDMTATQAGQIETDLAAIAVAINAINAAQAAWGITKSS